LAHGFFRKEFAEVQLEVVSWYPERFDWTKTGGLLIFMIIYDQDFMIIYDQDRDLGCSIGSLAHAYPTKLMT
jgi:hypothetical protein